MSKISIQGNIEDTFSCQAMNREFKVNFPKKMTGKCIKK